MRKCIIIIALCITFYLLTDEKYKYENHKRFASNTNVISLDIGCVWYPKYRIKTTLGLQSFKLLLYGKSSYEC